MANFWDSFNKSLANTAIPSFAESLKYGNYQNYLDKQQAAKDEAKRLAEVAKAEQASKDAEASRSRVTSLLSKGKKITPEDVAGLTPAERGNVDLYNKLTATPKSEFTYDYSGPTIKKKLKDTGEMEDTGQPNPYHEPKTQTITGYDERGRKINKIIDVDSGKILKEIDTGFRKKNEDSKKDEFDPFKYQKTISYYWNKKNELNKTIANLDVSKTKEMDINIYNRRNANLEQEVYMSLEPEARQIVDEHYDDLKSAGADSWQVRSQNQDKLKQSLIETLKKDYANKRISKQALEGASLWANYKYGFLK